VNFVLILSVGTVAGCVVVAKLLGQPIVLRRRVARRLNALRPTAAKKSPRRWSLAFPRLPFRKVQAHTPEERLAALLDVIARELRLGSSVNAALLTAMSRRAVPTLAWLVQQYRQASAYQSLSVATKKQRDNILKSVVEASGTVPFRAVTRKAIVDGRERRMDTSVISRTRRRPLGERSTCTMASTAD